MYIISLFLQNQKKLKHNGQENLVIKIYSQSFLPIKKTSACTKTIINRFLL